MLAIAPGRDAPLLKLSPALAGWPTPGPRLGLCLPQQRDRIVRVRISEASYAAALDLAGADQPHKVLLYAQIAHVLSGPSAEAGIIPSADRASANLREPVK